MTSWTQRLVRQAAALAMVSAFAAIAASPAGAADAYPNRPIKMIVPYPPGGGTDVVARVVAPKLAEVLKQPVVIDNRGGAGGTIGGALAAQSPADGYTILITNTLPHTSAAGLYPTLSFDPVKSFNSVGMIGSVPYILVVNNKVPAHSVKEFIALAKAQPGKLNYGSAGTGSATHLAAEFFKTTTGTDITHIAYKGGGPALTDLLAGQVQADFETVAAMAPYIQQKSVLPMAVTSDKRSPLFPDVPSVSESGYPGFDVAGKFGLVVPAGTSPEIIAVLNKALNQALASDEMRKQLATLGMEPMPSTPKQYEDLTAAESVKWLKVIRDAGIKNE